MKKITISILLITNLYSFNDLNQTSLDMFLFKIGFKALASDVEIEKNNTKNNKIEINKLKEQVQSMLDMNSKNKLYKPLSLNDNKESNNKIKLLEDKIEFLQKKLDDILKLKVKNIITNKDKTNVIINTNKKELINTYVAVDETGVYISKSKNSELLYKLKRWDKVKLSYCTKYGWCKLYEKDGFIAKYKLKF